MKLKIFTTKCKTVGQINFFQGQDSSNPRASLDLPDAALDFPAELAPSTKILDAPLETEEALRCSSLFTVLFVYQANPQHLLPVLVANSPDARSRHEWDREPGAGPGSGQVA